jgi:hypothetical protein
MQVLIPPITVTVKVQVEVLPSESFAVVVTVVVPAGKVEPDAGTEVTVTGPGQLGTAVGAGYVTIAEVPLVV